MTAVPAVAAVLLEIHLCGFRSKEVVTARFFADPCSISKSTKGETTLYTLLLKAHFDPAARDVAKCSSIFPAG
jgi:hypothetical protein